MTTLPPQLNNIIEKYSYKHLWNYDTYLKIFEQHDTIIFTSWNEFESKTDTYGQILTYYKWVPSVKIAEKYNVEDALEYIEHIREDDENPEYNGEKDPVTDEEKIADYNSYLHYETQNYFIFILQQIEPYRERYFKVYINLEDEDKVRNFINDMVQKYVKEFGVE